MIQKCTFKVYGFIFSKFIDISVTIDGLKNALLEFLDINDTPFGEPLVHFTLFRNNKKV